MLCFFPALLIHKIAYQIGEAPFCPFYRRKTKGKKKRILNNTLVYKQESCIAPTTAPCLSLLLIQWWGLCCVNDVWELQTISYSWLAASAFNKCLLCTHVTFWLPTLKSTCQDGMVPAHECGPAAGARRRSACGPVNAAPLQNTSLFSQPRGAHGAHSSHLISRGYLDSCLGFLMGHGGRSGLASSERIALAEQLPWPQGPCSPQAQ